MANKFMKMSEYVTSRGTKMMDKRMKKKKC